MVNASTRAPVPQGADDSAARARVERCPVAHQLDAVDPNAPIETTVVVPEKGDAATARYCHGRPHCQVRPWWVVEPHGTAEAGDAGHGAAGGGNGMEGLASVPAGRDDRDGWFLVVSLGNGEDAARLGPSLGKGVIYVGRERRGGTVGGDVLRHPLFVLVCGLVRGPI